MPEYNILLDQYIVGPEYINNSQLVHAFLYSLIPKIDNKIMQYIDQATLFFQSKSFWYYHGYGLTISWLGLSFISILLKKLSSHRYITYLHAFLYLLTNVATIFLAGGAFYRVYPNLSKFSEWNLLKQLHIAAGILFTVFVVIQHLGGATLLMFGGNGKLHRTSGMVIGTLMGAIVVFGWLLVRDEQMVGLCAAVAVVEAILLLSIGGKKQTKAPTKKL